MSASRVRAGRRKSALPADAGPAITALKKWLRQHVGDIPLERVAAASMYSVSAVSSALGGTELPRLRLVRSIASGIGAPQGHAHELWWAAALEEFTKNNPSRSGDPLGEFALDLRKAMLKNDLGPTDVLRRMARLCAAEGDTAKAMSRATLSRLLAGTTLPRSEQMDVFLRVINLRDGEIERLTSRYDVLGTAMALVRSANLRAGRVATAGVVA
ncbi:hypothetical protein [Amycolatopsis sp. NPDC004169]|uniref:hypothetical protein n=1 Tax=Amycolatopsis sp. NPDC004169 TaxID=3154453 RepID=UPI00339E338E